MGERIHVGCHRLHQFAKLLAHNSEIALYLLHEHALALDKQKFLHVDFILDEVGHGFNVLFLFNINGRNHNLSQWLTHLDVYLTTQGKGH